MAYIGNKVDGGLADGNAVVSGTLNVSNAVTANGGIGVDNITIDGTEIDLSSGDLTIDVAGDLVVNADGGNLVFQDDTDNIGELANHSGDFGVNALGQDKHLLFKGNDGGSTITALDLDMENAGAATFNSTVTASTMTLSRSSSNSPNVEPVLLFDNIDSVIGANENIGSIRFTTSGESSGSDANLESGRIACFSESGHGSTTNASALAFYTASSEAASSNERIRIDSSGHVLINNTAYSANGTLVVQQTADSKGVAIIDSGAANTFFLENDGTINKIRNNASVPMAFETANTERMRIGSSGEIQIGGTTNAGFIDFDGSNLQFNTQRNPNTGTFVNTGRAHTSITMFDGNGTAANSYIRFMTTNANNTGATERMRIGSAGDVSIGTSISPPVGLTITADEDNHGVNLTRLADSGNPSDDEELGSYAFNSNAEASNSLASAEAKIVARCSQDHSGSVAGTDLEFYVKPNGTGPGSAPTKVHCMDNARNSYWGSFVAGNITSGNSSGFYFDSAGTMRSSRATSSNSLHWYIYNSNGNVGSVSTNGSSTAFNTSSDYRLKENVVTDWDATSRLTQLKPSRFNFKADKDTTVDGFLAHEVSSIVPEAITGTKDETVDLGTIKNKDGNIVEEDAPESKADKGEGQTWTKTKTENVYQSIDQSKLVPLLVKTIQELEARIAKLEE